MPLIHKRMSSPEVNASFLALTSLGLLGSIHPIFGSRAGSFLTQSRRGAEKNSFFGFF
jgi:hypothetical protein